MSLSLAILIIVVADAALIGLLAFVMSRASRLTPHLDAGAQIASSPLPGDAARAARKHSSRHATGHIGANPVPARS